MQARLCEMRIAPEPTQDLRSREVGGQEMHRRRKLETAILDALGLETLSCRMVYLEDIKDTGKCRSTKREAVKSRTDQDILPYAPERCLPQRILGISERITTPGTLRCSTGSHRGRYPALAAHAYVPPHPCEQVSAARMLWRSDKGTSRSHRDHSEVEKGRAANAALASATSRAQCGWGTIPSPIPSKVVRSNRSAPGAWLASIPLDVR